MSGIWGLDYLGSLVLWEITNIWHVGLGILEAKVEFAALEKIMMITGGSDEL